MRGRPKKSPLPLEPRPMRPGDELMRTYRELRSLGVPAETARDLVVASFNATHQPPQIRKKRGTGT